jgi:hypothetical protein
MASTQIQGTVTGMSPGVNNKCTSTYPTNNTLSFDSGHVQRSALLLLSGLVYVAFSPGDNEWENGWIFGYMYESTPPPSLQQTSIFATTPYGTGGGIWGSGAGPASDRTYIYTVSGNGTFDPPTGDPVDWGDSVLKLLPPSSGETFPVIDFYDPPDNLNYPPPNGSGLCANDEDFYAADPQNPVATPLPIYQYILPTSGSTGPISTNRKGVDFNTTTTLFCHYGPTPSVSSTSNTQRTGGVAGSGVLWAIETHRNINNPTNCNVGEGNDEGSALHAFDATTLQELYNSATSLSSELPDAHFNDPMIFQGRVYVGPAGGNKVYVFGMCSEGPNGCVQPH